MYSTIETKFNKAKQRIDAINDLRINRALAAMLPVVKRVYTMLPVFLHYNHPCLPGYIADDTPAGVCAFTPSEEQISDLSVKAAIASGSLAEVELPGISGIYSMGSTSSIGQNESSDLDIWVCYEPFLTASEVHKLQNKCKQLEQWAASLGVEVNLFMIDQNRFRLNECGCLGDEDCGSTLNILLLDEFYRSAVRLAGKPVLWAVVPVERENDNYDRYVQILVDMGIIKPDDWLDLGGLGSLSAEEYFGASLWQLYKSIDSPYKAVLKSLLLEAYSWEYPETQLLAAEAKQRTYRGESTDSDLDSYLMMLERVSRYLTAIDDQPRLDLIRRCFYLKVCEPLSQEPTETSWRYQALRQLVDGWGWTKEQLQVLDNRCNWKIEQVSQAHDELLEAMMQSYRNLIRFARKNNLSVSASPQDIGVLTRKLYAAFEALPGKITLVNPLISPDLSEPHLTFIHVQQQRVNRSGWYLYNKAPIFEQIISHQPLEYHSYLSKLIAWSYFNGLLTPETELHIKSAMPGCEQKVQRFVADISSHFPIRVPASSAKALYSPCEIRHLAIIVNLENDPTDEFRTPEVNFDFQKLDVFNFGQQQQCLIGSIDLLYRNSWNEVRTLHFTGEQAVLDALKTILGKMHQDAQPPESVDVFCYSQHLGDLIADRVQLLVAEAIDLRLSINRQDQGRFKAVKIAGQTWGLFFERLSVSVQKLENAIDFYGAISNNKLSGWSGAQQSAEGDLPAVIDGVASEGIIQFFFEDTKVGFTLYILDETNQIEVFRRCEGCKAELVRDVSRFYASSHDRFTYGSSFINFNLPQFYQIATIEGVDQVVPFDYSSNVSYFNEIPPHLTIMSESQTQMA